MTHYSLEAWTDFARKITPEVNRRPMQEHLNICRECAETVSTFHNLADLADREQGYLPPANAVRCVKALYHVNPPVRERKWSVQIARLVRSAFQEPVLEGVRGAARSANHILYRRGTLLLDMHIEARAERDMVAMTGQLVDPAQADVTYGSRPVAVLKGSDEMARTVTNQFGEFQLEFCPGGDLMLVVDLEREVFLVSPLPPSAMTPPARVHVE